MLINLRKTAGSWVVKGLLLLLVASFAVWGVGDILRTPTVTAIAVIGDYEISQRAFSDAYRRAFQRLQRQFGDTLGEEDARRLGLADTTLQEMVTEAALDQIARRYGLVVSGALVAQDIRRNAAFQDTRGEFDIAIYERILRDNGISVEYYEAVRRGEIVRELLAGAIMRGAATPAALADAVYGYREERRIAEYAVLPLSSVPDPGAPDEAALTAFHREQGERFMAPEYRAVTYLAVAPQNLVAKVQVEDIALRDEYELRKEEFHRAARRELEQLLYADRAAADQAMARLTAGEALAAVAQAVPGLAPDAVALGWLSQNELPEEIQEAVFAAPANGIAGPVESPFGWHIVRVVAIEPEAQETFEAAKERLHAELALERAREAVAEIANQIEDQRAAGATLEEVANKLGLTLATLAAVDAAGRDRDGQSVAAAPSDPEFLGLAFETAEGQETELTEDAAGGYFVLRVDGATSAAVRPLETVREAVAAAWRAAERDKVAATRGAALAEAARGGAALAKLAEENQLSVHTTSPFTRRDSNIPALSDALVAMLFAARPGEVAAAPAADGSGHVVARLVEIVTAHGDAGAPTYAGLAEGLKQGMAQDILAQYRDHLVRSLGLSVNQEAMQAVF